MAYGLYKAQAPGSIMLFGEHAVLHGKLAIVAAVDQWVEVVLEPRDDSKIRIQSSALGEYQTDLHRLTREPPFQFILEALLHFKPVLENGCKLTIQSDFSHTLGLGSSAAVTAATVALLSEWIGQTQSKQELFLTCRDIIRRVQGAGSGADLAASIYGGVVAYRNVPLYLEKLPHIPPISLVYSGKKVPTADVINLISQQQHQHTELFRNLYEAINYCSQNALRAIKNQQWADVGKWMNIHQGLQEAMGLSNQVITDILSTLHQQPSIFGAKISGAGLGDCVVATGECSPDAFKLPAFTSQGVQQILVNISEHGLQISE